MYSIKFQQHMCFTFFFITKGSSYFLICPYVL